MRATKAEISLELECCVDELSPAQLAAYEKVANEHNAIKNALKTALSANEGKELFNGQLFQAYSFKGKVLQELKEATLPKKVPKSESPTSTSTTQSTRGRKRSSNFVYLESSDEEEDDVPLAKRIAVAAGKKSSALASSGGVATRKSSSLSGKTSPQLGRGLKGKGSALGKSEKSGAGGATTSSASSPNFRPSEVSSVGGLVIGADGKDGKDTKENNKETKLQGKTFPSLVVLAKPWLKIKDMSATRNKLDSKVKLVLMLTPNKFTEWLIQEGLLKAEQKCANHRSNELKLGVYSDATKFPYTGGYVWISECCPMRFVSVFHGSIFEGAPHPPSCILKLIYHWSCQTNIQNVVQWVKVDNVYIKGVYTWLRAICTLAVHQKCKKLGGPEKFVEVGVISFGTTSQDGQQRQLKVEVLGVLDYGEKTIRLRAVEPFSDSDRNYKKRFQIILEPLQRWVHKDSIISIDLTVDKMTLYSMGFRNVVQASATDSTARHTNSAVMDYLRRIVPRMFQNTLSLLSRQMIQQFLDELVWREQFGTYALQAFNNITAHIAEQTRLNTNESLTQRLYQVATNPFKDWSVLPANCRETPANTTPKRLKKPINEADYIHMEKMSLRNIKKEKETRDTTPTPSPLGKRRSNVAEHEGRSERRTSSVESKNSAVRGAVTTTTTTKSSISTPLKKIAVETKTVKKEEDDLKGLEEMYYGVLDGFEEYFEQFPYKSEIPSDTDHNEQSKTMSSVVCPMCETTFNSNVKLQTHLLTHINIDGKDHPYQCPFCLEKMNTEFVLAKHSQIMHPSETKASAAASYRCLICQQRFNSLNLLTAHLQKVHNMLELPYCCQACGYRSSMHRDVVRHYYDDHRNQNFLQCPFCLDIFRFSYKGAVNKTNIENYFIHLRHHVSKKEVQLHCQKCALVFVDKGSLRQHSANHHSSLLKNSQNVRMLMNNSLFIPQPKTRSHHREPLSFSVQTKFGDFYAFIDGSICAECNTEIINEEHFIGLLKCNKCNYKTCCERAMFEHSGDCNGSNGAPELMELPLPNEMHCVCGFSTAIGNKMAHHLANCGQRSAYPTLEMAQENTVKRNMLDMLGLVRRDGEPGAEGDDAAAVASGSSAGIEAADFTEPQASAQSPIPFDGIAAASVDAQITQSLPVPLAPTSTQAEPEQEQSQQHYTQIVDNSSQLESSTQAQYHLGFGQTEVAQPALNASDIDMPLIGDLADPNPPPTPQFLGEVHTPMFDAVAAAEQQHYHQLIQQQQEQQHQQHQQQQEQHPQHSQQQ